MQIFARRWKRKRVMHNRPTGRILVGQKSKELVGVRLANHHYYLHAALEQVVYLLSVDRTVAVITDVTGKGRPLKARQPTIDNPW